MRNNTREQNNPDAKRSGLAIAYMAARAGYMDARAQRGLDPAFEAAPQFAQVNYELGRLWAVNMRAAGLPLPGWSAKVKLPREVERLNLLSAELVGQSVP